ncbi:MAG: Gfo/Idh/MocA family oxidoreductase [Lentisphaeria bacterium]|nr:Gfo/Idh/MocA family oxidoreductase [Lentisphaeria bacterium]
MTVKFAFVGFRHGHIDSLLAKVREDSATELVAVCEEDETSRAALVAKGMEVTHDDFETMLADVDCDVVAIGDYYGKRGSLAIRALEAGRHVIADKPLCTDLAELKRIGELAAEKKLSVGCQLDMRGGPTRMTMRRIILSGAIGEVQTFSFSGQHPLMYGTRPDWYFEEGKHGGTINDIAIHAVDAIPWMTGREIVEVVAARAWNAKATEAPFFGDCAQLMLRLDNGGGVIGDVSYLSPDKCGYGIRQYWRVTVHGTKGLVEIRCGDDMVMLATDDDAEPQYIKAESDGSQSYLHDFLDEIAGRTGNVQLTTALVLRAARISLLTQKAADEGLTNLPC